MNSGTWPEELRALARRSIWWKSPDESLEDADRLLAQVMASGTWRDVQLAKRYWAENDFVRVLSHAPPGVFDPRSWFYWHWMLTLEPVPPLPARRFR